MRLAVFLVGSAVPAEDLAQEAFVRLQAVFGTLERPEAYLRTTLVNLARNAHRTMRREGLRLVRHGVDPDRVSFQAAELDATLMRLPYEQRAVVVLRYWLGLTEAEISEHLGCRPGTVKSRHARALARIRKDLS